MASRCATILRYMEDSHLLERTARVLHVETKNNKYNVITDETIFYPQGGGQPYVLFPLYFILSYPHSVKV